MSFFREYGRNVISPYEGQECRRIKKLRVFLKWGLFLSKNQNVFNPVWTPGIMITIIVWDTSWIFQKCYSPQSRVINSLTRGSRLARPLTGLSTNAKSFIRCCKDKPIARGGPIKFRSPFWKEKKIVRWVIYYQNYFDEINTLDVSQWMLDAIFYLAAEDWGGGGWHGTQNISLIRNSAMGD